MIGSHAVRTDVRARRSVEASQPKTECVSCDLGWDFLGTASDPYHNDQTVDNKQSSHASDPIGDNTRKVPQTERHFTIP